MYDLIIIGTGSNSAPVPPAMPVPQAPTSLSSANEPHRASHTVWSSHYDAARLTHRSARNVQLAQYARDAITHYR
jgi:hypothetical protein